MKWLTRPAVMRVSNRIITVLLRLGAPLGPMALLTVVGRRSGRPRTTPVAVERDGAGWRLTAAYGVGDWVKNLRAAGEATLTIRGRRIPVVATELSPEQAAPQLRELWATAGPTTRALLADQFPTPVSAPVAAWVQEAERHPVFSLAPVER